ncbi:agmatinase [Streptomyces sp. NPDC018045]|uniref:agmatinase n=1 Tax=Streptomyces sp. NPDC018045 TaxID=3365037 RepID=UPI0037A4F19F
MNQHATPPRGPAGILHTPRYAGPATFARLPRRDEVEHTDIAVVGIPFDSGTTYRPGARFGPAAVRQGSRLLRPYHPGLDVEPFAAQQVTDAGDLLCTPFDIDQAITEITDGATHLLGTCRHAVAIGGDHTIALPMLRAVRHHVGQVAVIHFDAHLDTWSTYRDNRYNHGTPFRRAVEENLLAPDRSIHVGLRGSMPAKDDLTRDSDLGFRQIDAVTVAELGPAAIADIVRERVADSPVYVSVDIDVLDPAHAPGTGTPEAGGLTTRELLTILRSLSGLRLTSADLVEVSPAYDHAEITAIAAAHIIYELIALFASARAEGASPC